MQVRRATSEDADGCVAVLRRLPDHFTEDTYAEASRSIGVDDVWAACDRDEVVGFVVLQQRFPAGAEITFAAVVPGRQQRGIGTALVAEAVGRARAAGVRAIEVKTLDASSGYEPYVATRAFWEGLGFVQVDRIDPLPGWQPGNPSAIYVLPLPAGTSRRSVAPVDLWPVIVEERRSLLATFEGLSGDQWDVPSLSEGWTVRQVLAHLVIAADPPMRRYLSAVVTARGSFDRANHRLAVDDAQRPVEELLAAYRSAITRRFAPPGWPDAAPLADVLLHALDVRIPLGLLADRPPERYVPALDLLLTRRGRAFAPGGRPPVRWVADDHAWSHGDGEEVRGPIADLALTASGRAAHLDRLEGPGVARLRSWLR